MKKLCLLTICFFLTASVFAKEDRGQVVYEQSCKTCHVMPTAGLMKAPAVHNVKQWEMRLKAAEVIAKNNPKKYKTAMDYLVATVKNGKGAMVPGGMCQDQNTADKKCSDADYEAAINFMSKENN